MMDLISKLKKHNILYSTGKLNPNATRILKNNIQLFNLIIDSTQFLPSTSQLRERLFCVVNNITEQPVCQVCEKPTSFNKTGRLGYRECCSRECSYKSKKRNNKRKQTMVERYGVEYTIHSKELKQKQENTCLERYGVKNVFESDKFQQKIKETIKERYGVDNVMDNHIIKKKQKHLCQQKDFSDISTKIKQTTFDNNGYYNIKQQHLTNEQIALLDDKNWLFDKHYKEKKSLAEIANTIGVDKSTLSLRFASHNIQVQRFPFSIGEKELKTFIDSYTETMSGERNIISPHEIDIFLPEHNLAIEYNGLYWHSEQKGKRKWYHYNKWKKCTEQGIQLLTIFEDEWQTRQEQVKQKILSLIQRDDRDKVFGRKCNIVEVDSKTKRQFFNNNHIQGDGPSSINIGLLHNNELVAVMGFIKQKNQHYLNRYATSARVIGGFSKLLKYFQRNYDWDKLISFADLRWSDGNLYQTTGWTLDNIIPPDYYYSPNGKDRIHKFNYRRKNLPKLLNKFNPELSEWENCKTNNVLRIWDCGKMRFTISNNSINTY